MAFLRQELGTALVNVKLTSKGREFLAKGFKDDNVFDVVKFSFGDSEVDYRDSNVENNLILEPSSEAVDLKYKIYASGVAPSGTPIVSLSSTDISMSQYQNNVVVSGSTTWPPIEGNYSETYLWTNLGPLNDYDFNMTISQDTRLANISSLDVTGSTKVRIVGQTTGKYAIMNLTIG